MAMDHSGEKGQHGRLTSGALGQLAQGPEATPMEVRPPANFRRVLSHGLSACMKLVLGMVEDRQQPRIGITLAGWQGRPGT